MEETHQEVSDQSNQASGDDKKDVVAYETHRRLLGEKKAEQERRKELEQKLDLLSNEKLAAEGKKDELISNLQSKVSELTKVAHEKDVKYGYSKLQASVREKALKHGCKDPSAYLKLVDSKELETVAMDDDYNVDGETVEQLIERTKSKFDYLFGKSAPKVDDATPSNKIKKKTLGDMSMDEKMKLLKTTL